MAESAPEKFEAIRKVCAALPKSELHLHLDGSIPMPYILQYVKENGILEHQQEPTREDVIKYLCVLKEDAKAGARPGKAQNWGIFDWMNRMLQTQSALTEVTSLLLEELLEHNVRYAEIRFCPTLHCSKGLSEDEIVEAVVQGFQEGSKKTGIKGGVLICALRSYDKEHSMRMAKLVQKYSGKGILGFDIAGDERYPLEIHKEALEFCISAKLPVTVHAGERLAGPDGTLASILPNLDLALDLGVQRIGHGFAVSLNDEIFSRYSERGRSSSPVVIEVCLTAVTHWLVTSGLYKDHPIRSYFDSGIPVCLSCDNLRLAGKGPNLGTTPTDELCYLVAECGFPWADTKEVLLNGVRSSFLPEPEKLKILQEYEKEIDAVLSEFVDER